MDVIETNLDDSGYPGLDLRRPVDVPQLLKAGAIWHDADAMFGGFAHFGNRLVHPKLGIIRLAHTGIHIPRSRRNLAGYEDVMSWLKKEGLEPATLHDILAAKMPLIKYGLGSPWGMTFALGSPMVVGHTEPEFSIPVLAPRISQSAPPTLQVYVQRFSFGDFPSDTLMIVRV